MIARLAVMATLAVTFAQPKSLAEDITGAWSFRADVVHKGCTLTGNMSISLPEENGVRTCSFVSTETCKAFQDINIKMDQVCRITPQGESYIIRSEVLGTLTEGYSVSNYLADHFVVRPQSSREMKGIWQDAEYSASVLFWRDDNLPVS